MKLIKIIRSQILQNFIDSKIDYSKYDSLLETMCNNIEEYCYNKLKENFNETHFEQIKPFIRYNNSYTIRYNDKDYHIDRRIVTYFYDLPICYSYKISLSKLDSNITKEFIEELNNINSKIETVKTFIDRCDTTDELISYDQNFEILIPSFNFVKFNNSFISNLKECIK